MKPNLMQLLNATPMSPVQTQQPQSPQQQAMFGGMGGMHRPVGSLGGVPLQQQGMMFGGTAMRHTPGASMGGASPMVPTPMRANTASPIGQQKAANTSTATKAGGFDDLWNLSLASSGKSVSSPGGGNGEGKSMKDLQKEKATAGLWGGGGRPGASSMTGSAGFGNFGGSGAGTGSGGDDLLL